MIKFNKLSVEFIRATHSIADACSLAIFTPLGTIVHTGDFKIDYTPIDGRVMDLNRLSALGEEGVLLLMADSTNVERSGHSLSEKTIGETLNRILEQPNPWDRIQPQDATSRHRGAKPPRRCELLGEISLLSPR